MQNYHRQIESQIPKGRQDVQRTEDRSIRDSSNLQVSNNKGKNVFGSQFLYSCQCRGRTLQCENLDTS